MRYLQIASLHAFVGTCLISCLAGPRAGAQATQILSTEATIKGLEAALKKAGDLSVEGWRQVRAFGYRVRIVSTSEEGAIRDETHWYHGRGPDEPKKLYFRAEVDFDTGRLQQHIEKIAPVLWQRVRYMSFPEGYKDIEEVIWNPEVTLAQDQGSIEQPMGTRQLEDLGKIARSKEPVVFVPRTEPDPRGNRGVTYTKTGKLSAELVLGAFGQVTGVATGKAALSRDHVATVTVKIKRHRKLTLRILGGRHAIKKNPIGSVTYTFPGADIILTEPDESGVGPRRILGNGVSEITCTLTVAGKKHTGSAMATYELSGRELQETAPDGSSTFEFELGVVGHGARSGCGHLEAPRSVPLARFTMSLSPEATASFQSLEPQWIGEGVIEATIIEEDN